MMFKEIVAVYSENHMKEVNKNTELVTVKAQWHILHWALRSLDRRNTTSKECIALFSIL
jgi:hypothetical protein